MPHPFDADAEFDRQIGNLIELGYPALTGVAAGVLGALLEPLRGAVPLSGEPPTRARVPYVIVLGRRLVRPTQAMPLTVHNGRSGFVSRDTQDIDEFPNHASVEPASDVWLIVDVERGSQTLGATSEQARASFERAGRVPLTIEEGIALLTQFPETLEKNNCYQLSGTQRDRRVPGLWISGGAPKLGFCWAGNQHTWLGHPSCRERIGGNRRRRIMRRGARASRDARRRGRRVRGLTSGRESGIPRHRTRTPQ
jgi:hypothetical protein